MKKNYSKPEIECITLTSMGALCSSPLDQNQSQQPRRHTGQSVVSPDGRVFSGSDASRVTVAPLSEAEIDAYLDTGEPMDKAGAYAIQGRFSFFITHLSGTEPSVMGLSLHLLRDLLTRAGYFSPDGSPDGTVPVSQRSVKG